MKLILKNLILLSTLFYFSSCNNSDIANTASAVEGTYSVLSISAKTSQGQSNLSNIPDTDVIRFIKKDDRIVDIQIAIEAASVKFGSSQQDYLKSTYTDVNVEKQRENASFQLLKITNSESNGSLSGVVNDDGRLTLTYRISGTELFSISGKKR